MHETLATMIDVPALEQRPGGRQPHPVDLVVDRRFLLDVRVGGRDVGLGLVVVVVADEVLDRVVGKEAPELLIELRGQRLVVRHHQRRPVHARDALRHGEGLARPGDAEQDLRLIAALQAVDELVDGPRLIAAQLEIGDEIKAVVLGRHATPKRTTRCPRIFERTTGGADAWPPLEPKAQTAPFQARKRSGGLGRGVPERRAIDRRRGGDDGCRVEVTSGPSAIRSRASMWSPASWRCSPGPSQRWPLAAGR